MYLLHKLNVSGVSTPIKSKLNTIDLKYLGDVISTFTINFGDKY